MLTGLAYTQPTTISTTAKEVPYEKKVVVKNLYNSNIAEEFIAMQVDLEIPLVIRILKELDVYKGVKDEEKMWQILSVDEIPEEVNIHHQIFGKEFSEIDYDSIGQCLFCNSRIDEFNFCACGGNLGIS